MPLEWLTTPVDDAAPSGPDLVAGDDPDFAEYYYEAEGALPERYFVPGMRSAGDDHLPGTLFDPRSVRHEKEKEAILALLRRSRDLRLLTLLAQQQILAGRLSGFAEALEGIAGLMESQPGTLHPQDISDRRATLEALANAATVCTPLIYVNLAGAGEVTYRRHLVASGQSEPREGEVGLNAGALASELGSPGNRAAVDEAHRQVKAASDAIIRIRAAALRGERPFTLTLAATMQVLDDIRKLIEQARPDLATQAATPVEGIKAEAEPVVTAAAVPAEPVVMTAGGVANRAAAVQALRAIEVYFAGHEPSSASLLLVTQSRLLVGRPLIEAIETLLPEDANKARIDFGPETGFSMSMDRLRMLSAELASLMPAMADEDPGPAPVITSRQAVSEWLQAVEGYFRRREPGSPIPTLLSRARTYLDKDFGAIITDLMPAKGKG